MSDIDWVESRFAIHKLGSAVQTRWDVFHRAVNDVKASLTKACRGVFLQAQLHSSYLWSLAYRPFGSGAYQEHKSRLLEVMLKTESPATCTLFQSVWQDIRLDLGLDPNTTCEQVWDALAECNTFHTKGTLPKLSRWFSWNDSCEEQLPEFRVLKLCLGYHYQDSKLDPDLAEEQRGLASLVNESKKRW